MSPTLVRILAVDDHRMILEGLENRFAAEPDLRLVGTLPSLDGLLAAARTLRPQIVLLDIDVPGGDVFEAIADLKAQMPEARSILFSAFVRDHYVDRAYEAGAWGYLSKADDPAELIAGIRRVARGELAMSTRVAERSQRARGGEGSSKLALLTKRELQILRMIAMGKGRLEIAEALSRSPMTVDNHRKAVMKKLGINDRAELVRFALGEGLVEL